jgi:hypothetical protein
MNSSDNFSRSVTFLMYDVVKHTLQDIFWHTTNSGVQSQRFNSFTKITYMKVLAKSVGPCCYSTFQLNVRVRALSHIAMSANRHTYQLHA